MITAKMVKQAERNLRGQNHYEQGYERGLYVGLSIGMLFTWVIAGIVFVIIP